MARLFFVLVVVASINGEFLSYDRGLRCFKVFCDLYPASFCQPYDVSVTNIRADSAVLYWKTTQEFDMIERFKVNMDTVTHTDQVIIMVVMCRLTAVAFAGLLQ